MESKAEECIHLFVQQIFIECCLCANKKYKILCLVELVFLMRRKAMKEMWKLHRVLKGEWGSQVAHW